jgi:hypothetical protein
MDWKRQHRLNNTEEHHDYDTASMTMACHHPTPSLHAFDPADGNIVTLAVGFGALR